MQKTEEFVNSIICGDCLAVMREWPEESIDFVMFSPPYWGLRNYGETTERVWGGKKNCQHEWVNEIALHDNLRPSKVSPATIVGSNKNLDFRTGKNVVGNSCVNCGAWKGQLGLEPSWQMYVEHMVMVCRELKRVLKRTGSMYIVLGDTYAGSHCGRHDKTLFQNYRRLKVADNLYEKPSPQAKTSGYQPKCLMGVPWRVAFALIDDGWVLRERIVWHKDNPMPGSQKDRLTQTCEVILHFVRNTLKALLWRNELTEEWIDKRPKQVYFHVETHELRDARPPKEERYAVDELGNRYLVWKPLWRGFDYYYEIDAIREPHETSSIKRAGRIGIVPFNLRVRDDLETLKLYCLQEYEKATKKRMAYDHKGGLEAPESFHRASDWNKGIRQTMNTVINSLDISESTKSKLRTWWHNHQGHPKGKNPGDIVFTKQDIAVRYFPTVNRQGGLGYADPLHVKAYHQKGKNPGDFWSISTKPFKGAHFAVYPEAICVRPIKSSCQPNGIVLDPMCGSGTTCLVAKKLGRKFIGIEINPAYVEMAKRRLSIVSERLDTFIERET